MRQGRAQSRAPSSAHRLLHERADPCLVGGGQLRQREGGRPHGAFVEVRLVAEAERRVPRLELLRALEEADDLAVPGIRGIPYQVLGESAGALALMIAWSRSAMARSGSGISAIFASTSLSPSALFLFARPSAFSSLARSFIAARSSAVNPLDVLSVAVVLLADFCVSFIAVSSSASLDGDDPHGREPPRRRLLRNCSVVTWILAA